MTLHPIAHMQSDFPAKFGIPRQSGVVPALTGAIIFTPPYRDPEALRGLSDFSHLWLIWGFSAVGDDGSRPGWSPTVRPPRLGGNARMGVFATRSPNRPNPLGLSAVEIADIAQDPKLGPLIRVRGGDLLDGTPIYDIKPYLPYADSLPEAVGGFADAACEPTLAVEVSAEHLAHLPPEKWAALRGILALDPRPPYQCDPLRVYGLQFAGCEVKFRVMNGVLTVVEIHPL